MKRILTSMFFGLALTVCSTTAHADSQKWPYLLYPGVNTQMEVIWQDTATETDTICWGPTPITVWGVHLRMRTP